jgi:hypothetical protein
MESPDSRMIREMTLWRKKAILQISLIPFMLWRGVLQQHCCCFAMSFSLSRCWRSRRVYDLLTSNISLGEVSMMTMEREEVCQLKGWISWWRWNEENLSSQMQYEHWKPQWRFATRRDPMMIWKRIRMETCPFKILINRSLDCYYKAMLAQDMSTEQADGSKVSTTFEVDKRRIRMETCLCWIRLNKLMAVRCQRHLRLTNEG